MRRFKQGVFALLTLALVTFIGACETEIYDEGISAPLTSSFVESDSSLESETLSSNEESELPEEESTSNTSQETSKESEENSQESVESSEESSAPSSEVNSKESTSDGRFELPEDNFH